MNQFVTEQLIYVLRLVAAALCGGLIGCERQSKKKTAGTRTHVIIAVASAMMMIISKYGFGDVLNEYVKLDPSRVAAGVVTAIGFIGSGIIIFRNNSVNGITTSAGIWATVYVHGSGNVYSGGCIHGYRDALGTVPGQERLFLQKERGGQRGGD